MKLISINEIAILAGVTRETASKKLAGIVAQKGPKSAKLYDSTIALRKVMGLDHQEGDPVTPAQAQLQLTIARKQEIDLNMEVLRKERIPIDVVNEIQSEAFSAINGILKSIVGKVMTDEVFHDAQQQLRDIPAKLKW
jgi:hypothetical protein